MWTWRLNIYIFHINKHGFNYFPIIDVLIEVFPPYPKKDCYYHLNARIMYINCIGGVIVFPQQH